MHSKTVRRLSGHAVWIVLLLATALPMDGAAKFTPMWSEKFLLAGSSDIGLRDGAFSEAAFQSPAAIALNETGDKVYVADTGNHAVRVVDLGRANQVETLYLEASPKGGLYEPEELCLAKGGNLIILGKTRKGMWRLPMGGGKPVLIAGGSEKGDPFSNPVADLDSGKVWWVNIAERRLECWDAAGGSRVASAAIPELGQERMQLLRLENELYFYQAIGRVGKIRLEPGKAPVSAAVEWIPAVLQGVGSLAALAPLEGEHGFLYWNTKGSCPSFLAVQGRVYDMPLRDSQGGLISDPDAGEPWNILPAVNPIAWLRPAARPLWDRARQTVYFSDAGNHRLVGWKWQCPTCREEEWGAQYHGPDYQKPRVPGRKRLLLVSTSLGHGIKDGGHIRQSFYKQFELQLGMKYALAGTGEQVEAGILGGNLGITRGQVSYTLNQLDRIDKIKPDTVVVLVEHSSLLYEFYTAASNVTVDDVNVKEQDAEWATLSKEEREKSWGPVTREMMQVIKKDAPFFLEFLKVTDDSRLQVVRQDPQRAFGHKRFVQLLLKMLDKTLAKLETAARGKPYQVVFLYLPFSGVVSWGDIQGGVDLGGFEPGESFEGRFAALCKAHGFQCIDLIPAARAVGPSLFPLLRPGDNHYLVQGHLWLGRLAAEAYFNRMVKQ